MRTPREAAVRGRRRLDRLSPLDVSNLRVEAHGLPMNVAAIAFLESRPLLDGSGHLRLEAIRARIETRLQYAPRLRQRLYAPGFGFGPPIWIDEAAFDVGRHVQTRPVPAPGNEEALLAACVELNGRPFDRRFPLWEIWFLTGLADGTIALLIRFHHVLADGIAAMALLGALFDADPEAPEPSATAWIPKPPPDRWDLLVDNRSRYVASMRAMSARIRHPAPTLRRLRIFLRQVARLIGEGPAPRLSFNRSVGKHERLVLVRADLERTRMAAHAHHATVNDVVLAAIGGGTHALLKARGELRPGLTLKVSVAASVRAPADAVQAGNLVGVMIVPVPVDEADSIRRLGQIAQTTAERKRVPPYQPAARLMQRPMVRMMNRQRLVNMLASNLPGPPASMFFAGARILEVFQVGVVQGNVTISVGVLSYAGQLNFDIVGATDVLPDLEVFANGVGDELARLGATSSRPRRQPIKPAVMSEAG